MMHWFSQKEDGKSSEVRWINMVPKSMHNSHYLKSNPVNSFKFIRIFHILIKLKYSPNGFFNL